MTNLQQKFPSGRVVRIAASLPIPPGVPVRVFLTGTEPGFLRRFLASELLKPSQRRVLVAPRIVQIPGRSRRDPNFGSAEAMQARKDGLVSTVATDWEHARDGAVADVTPMVQAVRAQLWQTPPAQRHKAVVAALRSFPGPVEGLAGGSDPEGTVTLTFLELPRSERPLRLRLSSPAKMESPVDHVLYDLVEGAPDAVRGTLFLVNLEAGMIVRLDPSDPRTSGKSRLLGVLGGIDRKLAGQPLGPGDVDADGAEAPRAPAPSPVAASMPEPGATPAEHEADLLAAALGAADAAEVPTLQQTAADARSAERVAQLRANQEEVEFPTRSGKPVRMASLLAPRPTPPVEAVRARGRYLDERVARPIFDGITRSYLESGAYDRDQAAVFASLSNDPVQPFYVEAIERTPSSDALTLKETVTVSYRDSRGRPGSVRVDLPIITRDGYMLLNGVKLHVTKQILAKPVIKVRPDEVLITTAYNKATVERFGQNASPRSVYLRQLAQWIDRNRPRGVKAELASATPSNRKFRNTVEYDDVAKTVRSIRTGDSALVFSRPALETELAAKHPWAAAGLRALEKEGGHAVGWHDGSTPVVVCVRADGGLAFLKRDGLQRAGDESADLAAWAHAMVRSALPKGADDGAGEGAGLPTPSVQNRKFVFSRAKMLSQYLPTAVIVGYEVGLIPMLKRAEVPHRVVERAAYRRSKFADTSDAIVFEDAVVLVDATRLRDLMLTNGLKELDTEDRPMSDFGPAGMGWVDHIADRLGSPGHARGLINFQASFIDPMTRELLGEEGLPTDMAGLLLHCNGLLEDNRYAEANDMANYRIRGPELVNTILYKALHTEMQKVRMTRESATPQKLAISQGEILRQLVGAGNVEEVKELNPLDEAEVRGKATWTGAMGGLGDGRTVTRSMRAFHPSMHGLFGFSSPDSQEIGVKRTLAYGAGVTDVRGRIATGKPVDGATRALALGELISPFTATHSDPPRIAMQSKQGTHTMPILRHTPMLVGSGAERSIVHAIGQTFAHKARADGTVVSIDAKNHIVELKHDDGSKSFVDLSPRSIKNSGGGFYITSQLRPRDGLRVGQKFEKDDVLAYDPSYFAERSDGSVAYKAGLLVRTAIVALDQTFEDSLMVTDHLVQETAALVTMSRFVSLGPQANLQSTAKVGDVVDPNSALAVFENVTDDADISAMLQRVGREFDDAISELTKNVAAAKYAGEVIEIRTYYNRDPSELSESLRKFLERQEKLAAARSSAVKDAPVDEPIRVTAPQRITRDKVSGETVDGVLIQFLIRVRDVAAPGDKYVSSSPLKGIISRVFEKGEEPTSEDGKQVDYIMSPLSIVSRMTTDVFLSLWSNSVLVGLKEKVLEIYEE